MVWMWGGLQVMNKRRDVTRAWRTIRTPTAIEAQIRRPRFCERHARHNQISGSVGSDNASVEPILIKSTARIRAISPVPATGFQPEQPDGNQQQLAPSLN